MINGHLLTWYLGEVLNAKKTILTYETVYIPTPKQLEKQRFHSEAMKTDQGSTVQTHWKNSRSMYGIKAAHL